MKVQDENKADLGNGHQFEIGAASWDNSQKAVRNRYPTSNGGCSSPSSSEILVSDIGAIVGAVAERDLLDADTLTRLIAILTASRDRLTGAPSLQSLLDRVTDENRHAEVRTGPAVVNEAW